MVQSPHPIARNGQNKGQVFALLNQSAFARGLDMFRQLPHSLPKFFEGVDIVRLFFSCFYLIFFFFTTNIFITQYH